MWQNGCEETLPCQAVDSPFCQNSKFCIHLHLLLYNVQASVLIWPFTLYVCFPTWHLTPPTTTMTAWKKSLPQKNYIRVGLLSPTSLSLVNIKGRIHQIWAFFLFWIYNFKNALGIQLFSSFLFFSLICHKSAIVAQLVRVKFNSNGLQDINANNWSMTSTC